MERQIILGVYISRYITEFASVGLILYFQALKYRSRPDIDLLGSLSFTFPGTANSMQQVRTFLAEFLFHIFFSASKE